jgi:hypothetical protein
VPISPQIDRVLERFDVSFVPSDPLLRRDHRGQACFDYVYRSSLPSGLIGSVSSIAVVGIS